MFFRSVKYIFLVCFLALFINASKAQSIIDNHNLIKIQTYCPTSPNCIYSGEKTFPIYTKIVNNSDLNLEIPLDAIKDFGISGTFKNIKTGEEIGRTSGRPLENPELFHKLTVFPAHSEIMLVEGANLGDEIKESFHDVKANQFLCIMSVGTRIYYQGSEEPIGYYKNDQFEAKQFKLQSQVIITKKKGLRLGYVLKKKDRPVIVY